MPPRRMRILKSDHMCQSCLYKIAGLASQSSMSNVLTDAGVTFVPCVCQIASNLIFSVTYHKCYQPYGGTECLY